MSDTKKRFDSFLARINAVIEGPPDEFYEELAKKDHAFWESLNDLERYQEEFFVSQRINSRNAKLALKVMESGIFHRGGLKGTQLDFDGISFEVHPINNLEDFVLEVVSSLEAFSHAKNIRRFKILFWLEFGSLEKKFESLLPLVKLYKGGRAAQKLERKRKEIVSLKEDILQRPTRNPKLPDIKKDIATIFHKFGKAPKVIIAERVANLLNFFGIDAKMESIRKKLKNK